MTIDGIDFQGWLTLAYFAGFFTVPALAVLFAFVQDWHDGRPWWRS
jgi:hypothetical protein